MNEKLQIDVIVYVIQSYVEILYEVKLMEKDQGYKLGT